tara:strand:+ start:581 stop:958 length:378 start_codon:yes stop_codon:yes gene_type:complete
MSATITSATIFEDTAPTFLSRVVGNDAANIQQSDFGAITVAVYKDGSTTATHTDTLTVSDVVFDSLQKDDRWTADATGYNFRHQIAASVFSDGDATYQVEFLFNPTSGEDWLVLFRVDTVETLTA